MKKHALKLMAGLLISMSAFSAHSAELRAGGTLQVGQSLYSDNNKYFITQQGDGNLVVYRVADMRPMWASYANGLYTVMQGDGNLVQYNAAGTAVWNSQTGGRADNANFKLVVSTNGAAYVADPSGKVIWNSPPDPSIGPCPGGAQKQLYPFCTTIGTYKYTSFVMACSYGEAWAMSGGGTFGYCTP